jgi:hypothetical protein
MEAYTLTQPCLFNEDTNYCADCARLWDRPVFYWYVKERHSVVQAQAFLIRETQIQYLRRCEQRYEHIKTLC